MKSGLFTKDHPLVSYFFPLRQGHFLPFWSRWSLFFQQVIRDHICVFSAQKAIENVNSFEAKFNLSEIKILRICISTLLNLTSTILAYRNQFWWIAGSEFCQQQRMITGNMVSQGATTYTCLFTTRGRENYKYIFLDLSDSNYNLEDTCCICSSFNVHQY